MHHSRKTTTVFGALALAGCVSVATTWQPDDAGTTHNYPGYGITVNPAACDAGQTQFNCVMASFTQGEGKRGGVPGDVKVLWERSTFTSDGRTASLTSIGLRERNPIAVPQSLYLQTTPTPTTALVPLPKGHSRVMLVYVADGAEHTESFGFTLHVSAKAAPKVCIWIC